MPSIESTGKTIEEALESALSQLGVPPERVEVEVLEEPGRAVLGLVPTAAKIRVTVLRENALEAERFLIELLAKMNIAATVEHRLDANDEGPAIIDIRGDDLGLLIGWRGAAPPAARRAGHPLGGPAPPARGATARGWDAERARGGR